MCAGQFGVFVYLVLCCLVGCCTWFSCCAANLGLSVCVWYCHVPGHWLSSGPWQESGPISGRLLSSRISNGTDDGDDGGAGSDIDERRLRRLSAARRLRQHVRTQQLQTRTTRTQARPGRSRSTSSQSIIIPTILILAM